MRVYDIDTIKRRRTGGGATATTAEAADAAGTSQQVSATRRGSLGSLDLTIDEGPTPAEQDGEHGGPRRLDPADGDGDIYTFVHAKRRSETADAQGGAKRSRFRIGSEATGRGSADEVTEIGEGGGQSSDAGEIVGRFTSRSQLLDALRGGDEVIRERTCGAIESARTEPPGRMPAGTAASSRGGTASSRDEHSADLADGPRVKRRQVVMLGSSTETFPAEEKGKQAVGIFRNRGELLDELRGAVRSRVLDGDNAGA